LSEEVFIKFLKAAPKMGSNYLSLVKKSAGENWKRQVLGAKDFSI